MGNPGRSTLRGGTEDHVCCSRAAVAGKNDKAMTIRLAWSVCRSACPGGASSGAGSPGQALSTGGRDMIAGGDGSAAGSGHAAASSFRAGMGLRGCRGRWLCRGCCCPTPSPRGLERRAPLPCPVRTRPLRAALHAVWVTPGGAARLPPQRCAPANQMMPVQSVELRHEGNRRPRRRAHTRLGPLALSASRNIADRRGKAGHRRSRGMGRWRKAAPACAGAIRDQRVQRTAGPLAFL